MKLSHQLIIEITNRNDEIVFRYPPGTLLDKISDEWNFIVNYYHHFPFAIGKYSDDVYHQNYDNYRLITEAECKKISFKNMFSDAYKNRIINYANNIFVGGIRILDVAGKIDRDIYVGQHPLCINNSVVNYSFDDTGRAHLYLSNKDHNPISSTILNVSDKIETMYTHSLKIFFNINIGYTLNGWYIKPCSLYVLRDIQFAD